MVLYLLVYQCSFNTYFIMKFFMTSYLKIAVSIGCVFKVFVLFFSPTLSSVETLVILVTVLFLVREKYMVRLFTMSLWSFVVTLFLLSILVKFSLYIEYGNFDYLLETPISASECFINFILNEVGMVKDINVVSQGNVSVIDNSVNTSVESNTSVVEKWKRGDYRPALTLVGEGSIKAMGAGVTSHAAFTLMGKSKAIIKVAAVGAASMTAMSTVVEAFIGK
jgi:hypothetical protein